MDGYLKVDTTKYFRIAHYDAAVRMTPGLSSILWQRLGSQHNRASLRAAIGEIDNLPRTSLSVNQPCQKMANSQTLSDI